jgi:hypothetical protein
MQLGLTTSPELTAINIIFRLARKALLFPLLLLGWHLGFRVVFTYAMIWPLIRNFEGYSSNYQLRSMKYPFDYSDRDGRC